MIQGGGTYPARFWFGLALLCFWLFAPAVQAAGCTEAADASARTVKVLALEHPTGLTFAEWLERTDSKVTCQLFKRLNLNPDFIFMPFRRAVAEMAVGNADMMVGANYIFEPEVRCHMPLIPYRYYRILAFYYATQPHQWNPQTLEDFSGKRLTTLEYKAFRRLTGLTNAEVILAPDVATKFMLLRLGRADYALGSESEIESLADLLDKSGESGHFYSVSTPFSTAEAGLVVNTDRPGMRELFSKLQSTLNGLRDEDAFKVMVNHSPAYLGKEPPHSILPSEHPDIERHPDADDCAAFKQTDD